MTVVQERFCEADAQYVQYYDHTSQSLRKTLNDKAKKFIDCGCLESALDGNGYLCHPIQGYNTRTYHIQRVDESYVCNCQGFQSKLKKGEFPFCSHVLAVILWLRKGRAGGR